VANPEILKKVGGGAEDNVSDPSSFIRNSASEMTYIVSSGALNSTHSLTHLSEMHTMNYTPFTQEKATFKNSGANEGEGSATPTPPLPTLNSPLSCSN